ncbi:YcjX family GTP-binding protein [Mangrovitalea sediminis]|uniref:YcjX family protein n=1 Tax=Mangrovitalea sediminis TaxID=1982043 RepID=UPI0013040B2E|nr:YcjX family protein [Mangrovitalea sediminis]
MSVVPEKSGRSSHLRERWNRLQDRTVRIAVTGLSQSGKTNFIISTVNQLLHPTRLPRFVRPETGEKIEILGTRLFQLPDQIPPFPYLELLESLQHASPAWPLPTDRLRGVRVGIRYRTLGGLLSKGSDRILYVDLLDYPGEWLLDLPITGLTFQAWSETVLEQCRHEPRQSLAQEWLLAARGMNVMAPFSVEQDHAVQRIQRLYTQFLQRCKAEPYHLSYLQPGFFLMPGRHEGTLPLNFFPVPAQDEATKGSVYAELERRFEAFKKQVVGAFYRDHFAAFDRQIVLVDVITALNSGPETFRDMQKALEVVLESFRYGRNGLLSRFFSRNRIDKLVFAATKADHVPTPQHANLRALLDTMVENARATIGFKSALRPEIQVLSSLRCTETIEVEHEGHRLSCLKGVPEGCHEQRILYPGEVPATPPSSDEWGRDRFDFKVFLPPVGLGSSREPLPHIGLDLILRSLIGDKFQ